MKSCFRVVERKRSECFARVPVREFVCFDELVSIEIGYAFFVSGIDVCRMPEIVEITPGRLHFALDLLDRLTSKSRQFHGHFSRRTDAVGVHRGAPESSEFVRAKVRA